MVAMWQKNVTREFSEAERLYDPRRQRSSMARPPVISMLRRRQQPESISRYVTSIAGRYFISWRTVPAPPLRTHMAKKEFSESETEDLLKYLNDQFYHFR